MDWLTATIALGGIGSTLAATLGTQWFQDRREERRYRREAYMSNREFLVAFEEAQFDLSPSKELRGVELDAETRSSLKSVEVARVVTDMHGNLTLRDAAYQASVCLQRLTRPELTEEERRDIEKQLRHHRAVLVDAVRDQLSPDDR